MKNALLIAAAASLGLTALPARAADAKKKLAVSELKVQGVEPNVAALAQSQLCAEIGNTDKVEVVCPDDIRAIAEIAKMNGMVGACSSDQCVKQLAEISKADQVLTGELSKVEKQLVMSLTLREAATGKVLTRVVERLPSDADGILKGITEV